jgi:hypothetical protein
MTTRITQSRPFRRNPRWFYAAIVALGTATTVHAGADVSKLAIRLAEVRGEVEELARKLSDANAQSSDAIRSLGRQRADLELELRREESRVQRLSVAVAKRRAEIASEKAKSDEVVPLFESSLARVREHVVGTLPFRSSERLAGIDKIAEQHKAGVLTASRALSRLWSFVEDEFRLTRESGLYKQTVPVDGEERLAEVVRLGMVMLFYKTENDLVGRAVYVDGKWVYESLDSPEQRRQVLELFTSFKKQVRVGLFELPGALPSAPANEGGAR